MLDMEYAGAGREARGAARGRRRRESASRPRQLRSHSRVHGVTRNARAVLLKPAGSRIMFQCLTNSTGGLGRSIVLNSLHYINNRIFSVSVTHCVRKKLCRRFWRILCKTVWFAGRGRIACCTNFLVSTKYFSWVLTLSSVNPLS